MKINYIPNRVIDANGIADGASLYVYSPGTTTPVNIYIDPSFNTPVSNPYVVAAGAAVPPLYVNTTAIRLKIVTATGTEDYDPYDPLSLGIIPGGAVDLGSLGVSTSGTAAANATIVNNAIATTTGSDWFLFPGGNIPMGRINVDRPIHFQGRGQGTDNAWATNLIFDYGIGKGFNFKDNALISGGAQRGSLRDLAINFTGSPLLSGTATFNTGSPNTITVVSGSANFSNGQVIALEGAGASVAVQSRTVAITSGTNTVTVTDTSGVSGSLGVGNPGVYVGQHVTVVGAGPAAADLVGYIGTWGSSSFTVVDAAGAALNAGTTVSASTYTIRYPLFGEITAGGGTGTLTIKTPYTTQNVTAAPLRHMDCGVFASCTIDVYNVEVNAQGSAGILSNGGNADIFLYGISGEGSNADSSQFFNVKTGGNLGFAGVITYGTDANVCGFYGCNFAGSKISFLDYSFLGNFLYGPHFAFNVGPVVVKTSAITTILGGYLESGTSFIAPANTGAYFSLVRGMINASGWQGLDISNGSIALGSLTSVGFTSYQDVRVTRALMGSSGTGMARFVGDGTNYAVGTTGVTGISLYRNSARDSGVVAAEDGSVNKSLELVGSNVVMRPNNVITGTWDNSLGGLNMAAGKALFLSSAAWLDGTVVGNSAGLGYATGAGGTVTQATSRTTGVTLNKLCGAITLVSAAGTATWQSFTVTNSTVAATDVIRVVQKSGTDLNQIHVTNVAAGSFKISFATTGGTTTEQPVFNFAVIKAVTA